MITVKLYGHLGARFGRIHRFDIATPAEAISALKANFKDFAQYLIEHSSPGYRVITDAGYRSAQQLGDPMGGKSIKFVPLVAGASDGFGQFVLGAVLVVLDVAFFHTGYIADAGYWMMVGGISQILFAPPIPGDVNASKNQPSYSFSGAVNTVAQGNPVPVCYGRLIVGSQVISGGMYADRV